MTITLQERDGFKEKWKQMSYKLEHLQRSEKVREGGWEEEEGGRGREEKYKR